MAKSVYKGAAYITRQYEGFTQYSFDGGKTWGKPFTPHRDGVKAEHGFVSLFAAQDGNLAAVWLDGRELPGFPSGATVRVEPGQHVVAEARRHIAQRFLDQAMDDLGA